HNFWYVRARERFNRVVARDPQCAMGYWGAAMTYNHPFWDPPSAAEMMAASTLLQKGLGVSKAPARERAYLAAVRGRYCGQRKRSEDFIAAEVTDWSAPHGTAT